MKNLKFFLLLALLFGITFMGFQCSSTELTSARLYIQQKNFDKALEVLQDEVTKNPKSDEGYYLLGYVYGEKGEMNKMIESFDQSMSISNKFSKEINESRAYHWANSFNRGVNLFQRGNKTTNMDSSKMYYEMSVNEYKNALLMQPDSSETYRNLAFVYLTMGDNEASVEPLQKLIDIEKSEDGYQYLGEVYFTLASNKMIDFRNDGNPKDSTDAVEMYNKAINVLEEGRKLYPENAEMLVALSNSYIGANKIDVAMDTFKEGVEKEPDNKFYRYNYGVLLLGAEMFEDAEAQFLKAIELDNEYENAIYNLAVTYVKWGTDINKKAEEQGVISEDYKKKYELALPYLEKVVEKDPDNGQIWELLGKVYSVLGMQEDATNAFNKADELR